MSIRIPMVNGTRPTPKTAKVMTNEQIEVTIGRLKEELAVKNEESRVVFDKWADPKWKGPQMKRGYIREASGQIRRIEDEQTGE